MKKRASEVTSVATLSTVSSTSAVSASTAPSVTFAADATDKETPPRAGPAPPTELLRGAPRLARRRIDSFTASDKQRRLSRATLAQDGGARSEYPAASCEDPQELFIAAPRMFSKKRFKDSMAAALDPSYKTSAPKKRANKSISPPEYGRIKSFRTQENAAMAIPSAMLQPEAKEQYQGSSAGTSKAFPTLPTPEARKLHAPMSLASSSSTSSKKLVAVGSAAGVARACFDDDGGKGGRGTSEESKKSPQPTKYSAERRCNGFPPRWFCLLLLALVAVLLTAVVVAFLVDLLDGARETPNVMVCHTHECHEYGRRLGSSLNESVRPCDSFTQFVCDGWRRENELGTYELLIAQGLESVARTLDAITVPQTGQSSAQRGAALYRSCEKLLYGERDDLAAVREALWEAGITWPRRPARADVLHTVLATSLRLGWDVLFRFVSLRSPQARLAINSGRNFVLILNKNKMALELAPTGTRRGYFSVLRSSMLPRQVSQSHKTAAVVDEVSFQEVVAIEELTLPLLSAAYYVPSASPERVDMADISELGPLGHSRARWSAALRKFGLDDVAEFVTANPEYVQAFLDLWSRLGENTTHVFVSWYTVQVAALLANQNLIVNFYDGNSRRALSLHVAFCLGLAYAVSGPVLFSGYNRHILRGTVRQDASRLLLGVRKFFRKRLVRWKGYDMNTTVVGQWSSLNVVFRELGNGNRAKTGDAVGGSGNRSSGVAENTNGGGVVPDLTEDSLVANLRKVSSSVTTGTVDDDAGADAEESAVSVSVSAMRMLAVSRASRDFTLMPYALSFPHFDGQLPAAVNYGGLGAEAARALGLLIANAYRSHPTSRVWLEDLAHCLSTSSFADDAGVDVAEALSLGALVDAYEDARAGVATAKLPGLESYTDLQLLFMALCFAKCRGSGARKTPLSACNLPLMYSPHFAGAFGCAVGTPMNQLNQCPAM